MQFRKHNKTPAVMPTKKTPGSDSNTSNRRLTRNTRKTPVGDCNSSPLFVSNTSPGAVAEIAAAEDAAAEAAVALQDTFWKGLLKQEYVEEVNLAADNEQDFRILAAHFFNRAFLFHRAWSTDDKKYVYDKILANTVLQDRSRLRVL